MKNKVILMISMLLTIVGNILADNLSVADINLSAGEEKQIAINLTNTDHNYVAFQFDMVLPEGVSVAKDNKGMFVASLNEDRKMDHTFTVSGVSSNKFRFLSYSGSNLAYYGSEGALLYVTLKADASFGNGDFLVKIEDSKFTDSDGAKYALPTSFTIHNPATDVNDKLIIENVDIDAGGEKEMAISLHNPGRKYVAFQFDLVLPEGISIAKNEKGLFVSRLNGERIFDHTITVNNIGIGNTYRILIYSGTNAEFIGNDGAIAYVTLKADDATNEGTYAATVTNQKISVSDGNKHVFDDCSFTITVKETVSDDDRLNFENVDINAGAEKEIVIGLHNPGQKYVAFQFDLVLPEGISIAKNEKGLFVSRLNEDRIFDHTITVNSIGTSNTYRILVYSGTNAEFIGNDGAIAYVTLKADDSFKAGTYSATVTNQKLTISDGTKYLFNDESFTITDIKAPVYSTEINAAWYTLQGIRLERNPSQPGIYLRDGRKIIVR